MKSSANQLPPAFDVTGIIMPYNWDDNGQVTQIAIYTNKEEVFPIEHNQKEQELMNYINRKVAVKGKISTGNIGKPVVIVKTYDLLAEAPDDKNDII